jgi:hypothetical protein
VLWNCEWGCIGSGVTIEKLTARGDDDLIFNAVDFFLAAGWYI